MGRRLSGRCLLRKCVATIRERKWQHPARLKLARREALASDPVCT
jgi:hypothetical protein